MLVLYAMLCVLDVFDDGWVGLGSGMDEGSSCM